MSRFRFESLLLGLEKELREAAQASRLPSRAWWRGLDKK